jgi:hypothetical protein
MASNRFVFGITLDQADALDGLIRTIAAHGDIIAAGTAPYLHPRTLPALGEAIYTAGHAARGILEQASTQALKGLKARQALNRAANRSDPLWHGIRFLTARASPRRPLTRSTLILLDLHQALLRRLLGRFLPIHAGAEERPLVAKRRVDRQHLRVRDGELVISAVGKG